MPVMKPDTAGISTDML